MSEKVSIYLVEDKAITRIALEEALEELGYAIAGAADSAEQAWQDLQVIEPDLVMLDIHLKGEKTGIWLGEKLQRAGTLPYIYLTAFGDPKTVKEAVQTQPHGYLIKPFKPAGIYSAIETALVNFSQSKTATPEPTLRAEPVENVLIKDVIFLKDEYQFVKIKVEDVHFVKAAGNYLEVHLHNKRVVVRKALKDLLPILPEGTFFQVHRSYVVNLRAIDSFTAGVIRMGDHEIPIGKGYREEFQQRILRL